MLERPNQLSMNPNPEPEEHDENYVPMLIISSFSVAIVFTLAGLSKFGNTSDAFFLTHKYMIDFYKLVTPHWNKFFNTSFSSEILRRFVGTIELFCMILLVTPMRLYGAILAFIVMTFVMLSHYFLNDPLASYLVPFVMALGCVVVVRLSLTKVKPQEKKL